MYKDFDDPWEESEKEIYASEKSFCINLVEVYGVHNVIDFGCGYGSLTDRLRKVCPNTTGSDISITAIEKAKKRYPKCNFHVIKFPDLDLMRSLQPDCIVM